MGFSRETLGHALAELAGEPFELVVAARDDDDEGVVVRINCARDDLTMAQIGGLLMRIGRETIEFGRRFDNAERSA